MKNLIKKIILEEIRLSIFEGIEHVQNLYKSWATKRSGNPEEALKLMDDVFKYQKKLSKKDFAQYSSYEELRRDIARIKSEERTTDATKIYEDNDLLVLAANTWEASCKYGAGSKWCTTMKDDPSYWQRHNQTGTEFFWVFKNKPQDDPNHKFSYHIKVGGGDPDWCNAVNNCMSTARLPEKSYPKQHPKYDEIIKKLKDFHNARDMTVTRDKTDELLVYQDNIQMLGDMIYENLNDVISIISGYDIERVLSDISYDAIENYIQGDVYDNLPDSISDDEDEDYNDNVSDYLDELEEYLQKYLDTSFDDGILDEISNDLVFLLQQFLVSEYNFDINMYFDEQMEEQGLTIVDVINKLLEDRTGKDHFIEILYEVVGVIAEDKVYYLAETFRENYKK